MNLSSPDIVAATPADLAYVVAAAKRETGSIGFLPRGAYVDYLTGGVPGGVLMARENGEPCGFLVWRFSHGRRPAHPLLPTGQHVKVIQTCVQYDVRRVRHGLALVARLVRLADRRKCEFVSLWCADDLPANAFWLAAGFTWQGTRAGGESRGRLHNLWVLRLRTASANRHGGNP